MFVYSCNLRKLYKPWIYKINFNATDWITILSGDKSLCSVETF